MKKLIILIILICAGLVIAEEPVNKNLNIYAAHMEPCVIFTENEATGEWDLSGFEIELWEAVGNKLMEAGVVDDWTFTPVDWSEIEDGIKGGSVDVAFAGLTIRSSRMEWASFSMPTFNSGLGIMVLEKGNTRGFFENIVYRLSILYNALIGPIMVFGVFILISAHFFWLIAHFRGFNGIDPKYFPGIFDAIFYCVVSSSTVGYGDQTPKKTLGRIATIGLIFCGGIFYCNFTAILSADYTTEIISGDIQSPEDLKGKIVVTQSGTTSISYLKGIGASIITSDDIGTACDQLLLERADAVVYDYPILLNYVKENSTKVKMVGDMFDDQYYGFMLKKDSPLEKEINMALLQLYEDGTYKALYDKWF
jgi:ABC-type amino acid transport substrate-binding protein